MSRICILAAAVVLSLEGLSLAYEVSPWNGYPGDPWRSPAPSGLRFTSPTASVQTGNVEGGNVDGYGMTGMGGCDTCSNGGYCVPWYYQTWYASWDDGNGCGHGHKHHGCASCGYYTGYRHSLVPNGEFKAG